LILTEVTWSKDVDILNHGDVAIPDTIDGMRFEIKKNAFLSISPGLKKIKLPNGITDVEGFSGFRYLEEVIMPDSVLRINSYAFEYCESLKTIKLPPKLEKIGERAFAESGLSSIVLPESLKSMSAKAFFECRDLESATIPKSLKSIPYDTFGYCEKLSTITIPDSEIDIDEEAFRGCKKIRTINGSLRTKMKLKRIIREGNKDA